MNPRTAVLRVLVDDEGSATAESVIFDRFPDAERRKVKTALSGLEQAGVLNEQRMFGGDIFWSIDRNVTDAELRQAMTSVGPGEVAEKIIEQSSLLGSPKDARKGGDDVFEGLL